MGIFGALRKRSLQRVITNTAWLPAESKARVGNLSLERKERIVRCVQLVPANDRASQALLQAGLATLFSPEFDLRKLDGLDWAGLEKQLLQDLESRLCKALRKTLDLSRLPGLEIDQAKLSAAVSVGLKNRQTPELDEDKILADIGKRPIPLLLDFSGWKRKQSEGVFADPAFQLALSLPNGRTLDKPRCHQALERILDSESTIDGLEHAVASLGDRFRNVLGANQEFFLQPEPKPKPEPILNALSQTLSASILKNSDPKKFTLARSFQMWDPLASPFGNLGLGELGKISESLSCLRSEGDSDQAMAANSELVFPADLQSKAWTQELFRARGEGDKDQAMLSSPPPSRRGFPGK